MRSTRATAAVARLNERSAGGYQLVLTCAGLMRLRSPGPAGETSVAMELDDFVAYVDSLGPRQVRRVTRSDAAFSRQLGKLRADQASASGHDESDGQKNPREHEGGD